MARVLVSDPLAGEGIRFLQERGHIVVDVAGDAAKLAAELPKAEAWIVRSGTQVTADLLARASALRAIGRAGVGVDNVDLTAATQHGVAVFNAPTGNITSAAEQAWALMLAAARRVPEADAAMKQKDWARKRLKGIELAGKTLLIVGLGRIGRMMAARAQAFEMTTIGFDPFVTPEAAASFGVAWHTLDAGLPKADIVTLHTPLVAATKGLLDAASLALCKKGVIIVNAARGGLVVADDLRAAMESGHVRAAGIDVWPDEPPADWTLAQHPRVVAAPHLGASTEEAQVKAALQACQRVCDFLDSGDAGLAVNAQATVPDSLRPWAGLVQALACFGAQTVTGLDEVVVCATPGVDAAALQVSALTGALQAVSDVPVNAINAPGLAQERGWTVASRQLADDEDEYVRVEVRGGARTVRIEGTYTPHYGPRVTSLDGYDVEFRPHGRFLVTRHKDVPGVLARITAALADASVNVASVSLARREGDGSAVAVIQVDGPIPAEARDALRDVDVIAEAHRIKVDAWGA